MDQSNQPQHGQETTTETKEQMILFQAQPDVYLQLIKDSPPTHLAHHAAYLLYFFTPLTSTQNYSFHHFVLSTKCHNKPSGRHHLQIWKFIWKKKKLNPTVCYRRVNKNGASTLWKMQLI